MDSTELRRIESGTPVQMEINLRAIDEKDVEINAGRQRDSELKNHACLLYRDNLKHIHDSHILNTQ